MNGTKEDRGEERRGEEFLYGLGHWDSWVKKGADLSRLDSLGLLYFPLGTCNRVVWQRWGVGGVLGRGAQGAARVGGESRYERLHLGTEGRDAVLFL